MGDFEMNKEEVCSKHGIKLERATFPAGRDWCALCRKEDGERRDREDRENRDKERQEHLISRLYSVAKLPARFTECTFDNYDARTPAQKLALSRCQDYTAAVVAGSDGSLILSGGVGTGKTHLGCAIANAIMGRIIERKCFDFGDVHYVTVNSLINEVRATWGRHGSSEDEVLDKYGYCALLVLDEAGVQRGSEDEHRILFGVINRRYENQLPTVVVSNLAVSNLASAMGERVVDRLRENGTAVSFDWASHRKHNAGSSDYQ